MKLALLLTILASIVLCGHIRSGLITVQYGFDGQAIAFLVPFNLENGLSSSDYFLIRWPELMHSGVAKTTVQVALLTEDGNQLSLSNAQTDPIPTDTQYYVGFGLALSANTWYALRIQPAITPSLTLGFVQLETVSDYASTAKITYDRNLAYGYYFIETTVSGPPTTLDLAVSSPTSPITRAGIIYYLNIDVTPTISSSTGGNFTISLYYDSTVPSHLTGSAGLMDFQIVGDCQAIPFCAGCVAATLNNCNIDNSLESLTFSLASVVAGQPIRIQTEVQNPLYRTVRGIRGYWVDSVNGIIQENKKIPLALEVASISLTDLGSDRVYLLWGIPAGYSDTDTAGVNIGIYAAQSAVALNGPLNSFNIGFKIQQTSPIDAMFNVHVALYAKGVLQGSIVHNFPGSTNTTYCSYTYPELICTNVGAFTDPTLRYFVSAKAYYDSTTTTSIPNFGGITLESVVYDDFGSRINGVLLFPPLVVGLMPVSASSQFLDLAGIHSSSLSVRYTQIFSYKDDNSRSALGKAMQGFTTGTTSTVGIVPNLNVSQQLIFLLNVPQNKMSSLSGNNQYQMKLLYNSRVIGFETGTSGLGLDFAGWSTATNNWTIQTTSCYQDNKVVTQKYFDNFTGYQTTNTQKVLQDSMNNSLYGIFNFQCGQSSVLTSAQASTLCGGDCVDECQIFKGFTNTDFGNGVISMRRVTFPTGYHAPLYADTNVLDFVITFINGGTVISSTLINAYTVEATPLTNIKAAYINYYDDASGVTNKGIRIPTMVRIGGAALANESLGADTVAVFFDQNTFANTFQDAGSYSIGCSTGSCMYYSNVGVATPQDVWHNSPRVEFRNIPTLMTEFNFLVPVTQKAGAPPSSLTLAFLASNYTVNGIAGLLRVLSVYRLFGPAISQSILSPIPTINSLATISVGAPLNTDFNNTLWLGSGAASFSYSIDPTLITSSAQNNTVSSGATPVILSVNKAFGAGITTTSFYYNIFSTAYLKHYGVHSSCTYFWYNYWEQPAINVQRTGKPVHVMYCPIDSTLDLSTSQGDVVLVNPQYPSNFVSGFPLQTVLAYGLSSPQGQLMAYRLETGIINYSRNCTTFKMTPYYPNSPGKQRSMFIVSFTTQTLSPSPQLYNSFMLNIQIPSLTVPSPSSLSIITTVCDSLDSRLACSITSVNSLSFNLKFTLIGTQQIILSQISFNIYATSSASFGPIDDYIITMYLPQSNGAVLQVFGPDYTTKCLYATCFNSFTTSLTGTSSTITLSNLTLEHPTQAVKGFVAFSLSFDYREAFFASSQLNIQLGFLQSPSIWRTRGDMICDIYEPFAGQPSWLWKSLDYTSFPTLIAMPKAEFLTPNTHILQMRCHGGSIPDAAQSSQLISASWSDSGSSVETSNPNLPYPLGMIAALTFSPTLVNKRFNNPGMLAYYTFSLPIDTALNSESRIYVEFPFSLPAWMNNNQQVECYMRTPLDNVATNDATSTEAFCKKYEERRLVIYTSVNVSAGSTLYFDIFNIQQPLTVNIGASSFISISLDLDSNLANGVYKYGQVADTSPISTAIVSMKMFGATVSPLLLQVPQSVTIQFTAPASTFSAQRDLYLILPAGYTPWNTRGSSLTINTSCSLIDLQAASAVQLALNCLFISRRIIRITVNPAPMALNLQLYVQGLISPTDVSDEYQNSVHFNLLLVSDTAETTVGLFSFDHLFSSVSLLSNANSQALGWFNGQGASLTLESDLLMVYTGYYRNSFSLRASSYPSPYLVSFNFSIANYNPLAFNILPICSTILGYNQTMYRMAAVPGLSPPLLYTLQFSKANDSLNIYSIVPPLKIVVSSAQCNLVTLESIYTIALGGATLPIIINASQCIPLNNISISVNYSAYSSELSTAHDLSNTILTSQSLDGLYYLVVTHTRGSLVNATSLGVTFNITGSESSYYSTIPSITLTATSIDPTLGIPVGVLPKIVSDPSSTSVTVQLQCSMPSTIYWAVGVAPTIIAMTGLDIQARIISNATGYYTNFTEPNDPYNRVYGVTYSSRANALVNQTVSGLRSNSAYQFRYFCMDQLGRISEGQTINFTSFDSGGYLLRLQLIFNSSLQYGQISDLTCSLAEKMVVPYLRVMTEAMSTCNDRKMVFYPNATTKLFDAPLSSGAYSYGIYLLPDYSLQYDNTNTNVKQKLADPLFLSKVITSTSNSSQLPWLISLSTQDILYIPNLIPTMSLVGIQPTETGVIINAVLTNMNGFIVVAMMRGLFYPNLTKPSQVNIKQGLFNPFLTLDAVQMQYSPMNINITFTISTLQLNTNYTLYYYATVDDPQFSALASDVSAINITTSSHYTITIDWEPREIFMFSLLLLVLLALG